MAGASLLPPTAKGDPAHLGALVGTRRPGHRRRAPFSTPRLRRLPSGPVRRAVSGRRLTRSRGPDLRGWHPPIELDTRWRHGLDYGSWSVLIHMYPDTDIPVAQRGIDETSTPAHADGQERDRQVDAPTAFRCRNIFTASACHWCRGGSSRAPGGVRAVSRFRTPGSRMAHE